VNVSAHHNNPFASANNGYGSPRPELLVNGHLMIRHISLLSAWLKSDLFSYSGRGNAGDLRFAKGECAIITTSSEAWPEIRRAAEFTVVAAPLPHYDDFKGAPYNTLMGGGALWTMAGKTTAEYAGVAQFLQFLSSPAAVEDWHQNTGFLPVTKTAENALRKMGYYAMRPFAEIASRQLHGGNGGAFARGVRLRHFAQIRSILDEELEAVWNNVKPPKLALDDAVVRGNALLKPLVAAPAASTRPAASAPRKPEAKAPAKLNCQGCR
jgi:sn-glycerol 3-phosphate transport system substrate-binding protein